MRELIEFRVDEKFTSHLFLPAEGKRHGTSVRVVQLSRSDSRFAQVGELQRHFRVTTNRSFFYGWNILRRYTRMELDSAEWLSLNSFYVFEPAGEECGTVYDEGAACAICGAGARQDGPLLLKGSSIPKSKDFAETIANEAVVSDRVHNVLVSNDVSGLALYPVYTRSANPDRRRFQLVSTNASVNVVAPTLAGIDPFDLDDKGDYRCSMGHVLGLNLLSEVSIERPPSTDIAESIQYVGVRRGLLRPRRITIVSQRVRRILMEAGFRGITFEVVHCTSKSS